jgi:apolipoprotein N-acyltransferase
MPVPVSARTGVRPLLPLWAALLTSLVAGPVLDLAFPAVGWWPLAYMGIAFSLVALVGRSAWGAFLVGLVFGASFYLTHILWITRYLGEIPWIALSASQALYVALGSVLIALAYRWMPRVLPARWAQLTLLPLLVGGLWTMRELAMGSFPYQGFPWARMGMSQVESPIAHLASWFGVTGLTFLMVVFCAAVVEWVRAARFRDLRTALPSAALVVVLVATPQFPTTAAGDYTVGSVQGNGPTGYFDPRARNEVLNSQLAATAPLYGQQMDLLLWPEGSMDTDPLRDPSAASALDAVTRQVDAPLLLNAPTKRGDQYFNTSILWQKRVGPTSFYDKMHPVIFGEYVPDRWLYEALVPDLISLLQLEYTPGTQAPYMDVDGVGVGLAICLDVIYDDVFWSAARDGAQVYLLQTNNADFRGTDENLQQLAFARMRAIETGRSVVNLSTVGTSQVIAPDGSVIDALPESEPGAMLTTMPLRTGLTGAVVLGPWIQYLLGFGSAIAIVVLGAVALTGARRRGGNAKAAPESGDSDAAAAASS